MKTWVSGYNLEILRFALNDSSFYWLFMVGVGWRRSRQPTPTIKQNHCHSERNEVKRRI